MIGLAFLALLSTAAPALAQGDWGTVECDQNTHPGCELGAGSGGSHGRAGTAPGKGGTTKTKGGSGGGSAPFNPNPNLHCSYVKSDYKSPPGAVATAYVVPLPGPAASAPPVMAAVFHPAGAVNGGVVPLADSTAGQGAGAWYVYKCTGDGKADAYYHPPIWIPAAKPGAKKPTPAQLADVARNELGLPSPAIEANPAAEQLVGLPTWLWLDRADWKTVSATASVPGVAVTAKAEPTSVTWTMGDGRTVTCKGPGTAYSSSAGNPKSASPTCGYTYRSSSAGQPGAAFAVSATVRWTVTWAGAGRAGTFPAMTTTSAAAFRVAESQSVGSGG
ncbi:hypothetical protein [Streptantibioticus silvisoli]|uniref:hypothetical protein n=1 Tax=Streptantibioticus silvisoli TaxID=2705255 RepID=UPI0024A8799D|nr:hypothetical protein [Streptantibioticus silvisoli]